MDTAKTQISKFDLKSLGRRLKNEPVWHEKKRNSFVLFKGEVRHVYLVAMHAVTFVPDHRTPCPVDIHVVEGRVRMVTDRETVVLRDGDFAMLEAGTHFKLDSEVETLLILEFFPSGLVHKITGDEDDYFDNWV